MSKVHFTEQLSKLIQQDESLTEPQKKNWFNRMNQIKKTKVNILITGATGCGKSSTINALFNTEKAKVGQGVDPQTMQISQFELDNLSLFDSPGLGDSKEADLRHAKNITEKLQQKNQQGELLIDLVLVILDGSSRDLGTSFELINRVIIPNLGDNKDRLLVAINQADMAMKGRYWDHTNNQPMPELINFLDEKVMSSKKRILEGTGVEVSPIYYCAGYKDGSGQQQPYNMSKLLLHIIQNVKKEKRAVFIQDINRDSDVWQANDSHKNYQEEVKNTLWNSICSAAEKGADLGQNIGESILGSKGRGIGKVVGGVVGGAVGFIKGLFD